MDKQYIVQHGDSLSSISKKLFGSPSHWPELARRNSVCPPYSIYTGQVLSVANQPTPQSVTFKTVDTLARSTEPPNAGVALGRGFGFVFAVDQLPDVGRTHLVRKVAIVPSDFSRARNLSVREWRGGLPEKFGIEPSNPNGRTTVAEHVQDIGRANSRYTSTSNKSFGAPTMDGRPVLIDITKLKIAGGVIHEPNAVARELRAFVARNPASAPRIHTLIRAITDFEGETLIEGRTPRAAISKPNISHDAYIKKAEELTEKHRSNPAKLADELALLEKSYSRAAKVAKGLRVVGTVGVVITVADLTNASVTSVHQRSFRPIGAETMRQVGGWGAGWVGAKLGTLAGVAVGIETGPGAIVTGALGAIVFGMAGYFGADCFADMIDAN